jgi:hypothetical protein
MKMTNTLIYWQILKGISKNLPYPLFWRGIKGEVKTKYEFLEIPLIYDLWY